jgi:putative protease
MFSRGSGPGFFEGIDHQRLVEGRACDHRGVLAGDCDGVRTVRGKRHLAISTSTPLARGDGILVEGGYASEGELGGRIWSIAVGGKDVERADAGCSALVWLGPDRAIDDASYSGRRVWKTDDPSREKAVLASIERDPWRTLVAFRLTGALGELPVLEATTARGASARVTLDAPLEQAEKAPLTRAAIEEKLAKLGDTPFSLGELELDLPEGSMLPISSLNRARRAVTLELLRASARTHATTAATHAEVLAQAVVPDRAPPPGGLFVLCRTLDQAMAAHGGGADGVYLDFLELTGTGAAVRALRALPARRDQPALHITLAPPRIRKPGEEKIDKYLLDLAPDALLVRGLGALYEATASLAADSRSGPSRVGDFSLNVTNKITAAEVLRRGLVAFTPSFDLDASQLTTLLASPFAPFAEVVVHHPMPLFHMEHCVIAALLSEGRDHKTCGRPCDTKRVSLRDRAGMDHPVEADVGCRNTVFHAASQSAAGVMDALRASGVARYRIELVRESREEVTRIVAAYRALLEGRTTATALWRTLKAEGGYGVVRGSLRILAS